MRGHFSEEEEAAETECEDELEKKGGVRDKLL